MTVQHLIDDSISLLNELGLKECTLGRDSIRGVVGLAIAAHTGTHQTLLFVIALTGTQVHLRQTGRGRRYDARRGIERSEGSGNGLTVRSLHQWTRKRSDPKMWSG